MQKMLTLLYHKARLQGGNLSLSLSLKRGGEKTVISHVLFFFEKNYLFTILTFNDTAIYNIIAT